MTTDVARATTGRLAPTPSGHLHLGNATAFAAAWLSARSVGGRLLLRFEDVDQGRARKEVEASQRSDLAWLGLDWDEEVAAQRARSYDEVLALLGDRTYRCTCTRQRIAASGFQIDGGCPGGCRSASRTEGATRFRLEGGARPFVDRRFGLVTADPRPMGDPVLRRRDGAFAYPLAVVADDLRDGVTEVVRGADLLEFTAAQLQIWEALGATPPTWLHAPLVLGPDGKKLSKSHGSAEIRALRAAGRSPAKVWRRVLPWLGIPGVGELGAALEAWDPRAGDLGPVAG